LGSKRTYGILFAMWLLLLLAAGVDIDVTLKTDGTLAVVEHWDAPRPERFLELQGVAEVRVVGAPSEETRRWVRVPADGGKELHYEVVGASYARRDGVTEVSWKAWAPAQQEPLERLRARIAFDTQPLPKDVRVELGGGARAMRWAWDATRVVCEFEGLSAGDGARITLVVPTRIASPPFHAMQWLKAGGASALMFGFPVAAFLLLSFLYIYRGRDAAPSGGAVTEAPLDPALMGVIVDEVADAREVVATWVDLAARGVVRFGEGDVVEVKEEPGLEAFEQRALDALRQGPSALPRAVASVYDAAVAQGLFRASPRRERAWAYGVSALLSVVGGVLLVPALEASLTSLVLAGAFVMPVVLMGVSIGASSLRVARTAAVGAAVLAVAALALGWPSATGVELTVYGRLAIGLLAAGAIVVVFAPALPARTSLGAEWRARALAMAEEIDDGPRPGEDAQALFERHLPYAIAFREKKRFVHQYAARGVKTPAWWKDAPLAEAKDGFLAFLSGLSARAAGARGNEGGG